MLRITLPMGNDPPVFTLEGRLVGVWVKELIRVTRQIDPGTNAVFDLEEVFYVDRAGEDALLWLNGTGARFITESAYGKDLCHRLHLNRVTADEPGTPLLDRRKGKKDATEPSNAVRSNLSPHKESHSHKRHFAFFGSGGKSEDDIV